jgi:preprotein translocase subunit SecD
MKASTSRFNLFLTLIVLLVSLCGCSMFSKKDEPMATMRIHIEISPDSTENWAKSTEMVKVLRADPVQVTIDKTPILTEGNVAAAKVISTPDAPAIEIRFDDNGTFVLEQYSAANPGKHFVIYAQWGKDLKQGRWLAAEYISRRINDGILSFTPDMSRDEADQFVQGLNNAAKQFQTKSQE